MTIQSTLHTLFEEQVARFPDHIAVINYQQVLTYSQLNQRANQLANYLRKQGLKADTCVALCMERSSDLLITLLGILKAGAAYVPLDASHPKERLSFILNDIDSPFLIITANLQEQFKDYQGQLIVLEKDVEEIHQQDTNNLPPLATAQSLAYVIYTSGSTGQPKGVLIEHKSVINYGLWFAEYCDCHSQQRFDFSSNYNFDMAVTASIVPLILGSLVIICPDEIKKNLKHYLTHLEDNKVSVIKITPSYFKLLLHEVKNTYAPLTHLETIILGGENLSTADCAAWLALYPQHILYNEYGPTEATVAVSQFKVSNKNIADLPASVPIGKPGPNMDCYIFDAQKNLVDGSAEGELYIGGLCLARAYLNQPDLTKKNFITHLLNNNASVRLYKTGDLCRRLPDGVIEYLGRIDTEVKIRGFRVEFAEIEKHFTNYPAIDATVVQALKDHHNENRLVAYYILHDTNASPGVSDMQQFLKNYLPDYMIPTAFVQMDVFPLTANGKIDLSALPMPNLVANQHYISPGTALEKTLAEIWSIELGVKPIGIEDDFFELGGHSLSATRIISTINHKLQKELSVQDFYLAPTIAKLAAFIDQIKTSPENPQELPQTAFAESTYLPLSDFQFTLWTANTFEPKAKKLNIIARKRLQGRLDIAALHLSFAAILKKNEVFFYQILKFRPAQRLQKNLPFMVIEKNLENLSRQESEEILQASVKQLDEHYPWRKGAPLIIARLFYLNEDVTELQIGMPHIISDDVTIDILINQLSKGYLLYQKNAAIPETDKGRQYRDYIFHEQNYLKTNLRSDLIFWEKYLQDGSSFSFPEKYIVRNTTKLEQFSYSTFLEFSDESLTQLQRFCAKNCVSIQDGLCAALIIALSRCCDNKQSSTNIIVNIVKSTRENQDYDEAIGCFLRVEPIKISLHENKTLAALSKQVHQSVIETSPYQHCSSLVKLAYSRFYQENAIIKNYLISIGAYLYALLFRFPKLNRNILALCGRLTPLKRTKNFLVNINVQSNFVVGGEAKKEQNLFGLKTKKIRAAQQDLLMIDYLFDVCFVRNIDTNAPTIVISANLTPDFRLLVAKEVVRTIESECLLLD